MVIHGTEGIAIQLASCCSPIPGDHIVGHLQRGHGLSVHTDDCPQTTRTRRKEPERWIDLQWATDLQGMFTTRVELIAQNGRGVLGRIAAEIGEADSNISSVASEEDAELSANELIHLHLKLQVQDRVHLANVFRALRQLPEVHRIQRPRG